MKLYALHLSPDRSRLLGNILHVPIRGMVYEDLQTKAQHSYINLAELIKNHPGINPKDLFFLIDDYYLAQEPKLYPKGRHILGLSVNPAGSVINDPITFNVFTRDEVHMDIYGDNNIFLGYESLDLVFQKICDYLMEKEINLLEGSKEEPVEPKRRIKELSEVEVGDIAYRVGSGDSPTTEDEVGEVVWVGDFRALLYEEEHRELYLHWEASPAEMLADYNELVVIRDIDGFNTLFNYNCDPCGVICFATN